MNIPEALADIDGVLASPSKDDDSADYARIVAEQVTRYKACIHRYAPPHSPYRHEADQHETMSIARGAPRMPGGAGPNDLLWGVLRALRADVERGKLASFEEMVRADVYADLIAQGKGLLEGGHSRAAAVLVGAALEDHVRKLAVKHQIQLDDTYGTLRRPRYSMQSSGRQTPMPRRSARVSRHGRSFETRRRTGIQVSTERI